MASRPQTILVTGASTGLGLALARRLLRDTAHRLVLTARLESLPRFAAAGVVESARVLLRPLDVTQELAAIRSTEEGSDGDD